MHAGDVCRPCHGVGGSRCRILSERSAPETHLTPVMISQIIRPTHACLGCRETHGRGNFIGVSLSLGRATGTVPRTRQSTLCCRSPGSQTSVLNYLPSYVGRNLTVPLRERPEPHTARPFHLYQPSRYVHTLVSWPHSSDRTWASCAFASPSSQRLDTLQTQSLVTFAGVTAKVGRTYLGSTRDTHQHLSISLTLPPFGTPDRYLFARHKWKNRKEKTESKEKGRKLTGRNGRP